MSVPLSSFYDAIRFLIQDFDQDVPLIQNYVIDSALRFVINAGTIEGYAIGPDNNSIIPSQSSSCGHGYYPTDYGWGNYAYQYGYGSYNFLYGNYYNLWYDQAFNYMINYQPGQGCDTGQDLTPQGNQEGWKRMCAECALWFVSGMTATHFRTRSTAETVAQPKDLLYKLEFYLDSMVNRGKTSQRPMPLPLVAIGIRSFYSGLWYGSYGLGLSGWGIDLAVY